MLGDPSTSKVAELLLATVRDATGVGRISYAEPPVRIEGGFDTRIFGFRLENAPAAFAVPLILRVFAEGDDPLRARWEETVQNTVAGMGYPAPRVLIARGSDNPLRAPFIIMERLPGGPMLRAATLAKLLPEAFRLITAYPAVLADYLLRLHALDAEPLLRALEIQGLSGGGPSAGISQRAPSLDGRLDQVAERIDRLSLGGLKPALGWLQANRPKEPAAGVICHGDFHPINVLMEGGVVTGVIDWANTTTADAAFDVGNTRLLLGIAPLDQPAAVDVLVGPLRKIVVQRFTKAYRAGRPLDMVSVRFFEALRCVIELAWVGERRAMGAGTLRNPWGAPRSVRKLSAHFQQVSGIRVTLER